MNEELDQIEKNNTWELVPRPKDKNVIVSKWVFKNKMNEKGQVVRNKAKLIYKGYEQVVLEDWLLSLMSTLVMGFGPED
jgi:hypothetical protein